MLWRRKTPQQDLSNRARPSYLAGRSQYSLLPLINFEQQLQTQAEVKFVAGKNFSRECAFIVPPCVNRDHLDRLVMFPNPHLTFQTQMGTLSRPDRHYSFFEKPQPEARNQKRCHIFFILKMSDLSKPCYQKKYID